MGTIADLCVHVGADVRDLESGFDRAGRAVGSMAKIVAAAAVGAGAAIGAAAKIGIEYNSQMENYTTNFKVMLGNQAAAVAKMEELKDMAASTPFELSGLADATQTLLAFQVPAYETSDILKMLGDVSLGNSQKLSSLTTVFGQVSSAGKLTGQDLMQFINAGFNPLNEISKRTGESMEDLRDRMSEGKVTVEEVTQAFVDATSAGGQFFNGMEEASHTMSGLISTLKDNARSLMGEVFIPISDGITKTLLPQAIGYIDELTDAFRENGVEGLVEAAGDVLSSVITTIAEGAPRFTELAVSLVESLLNGIMENLPTIVDAAIEVGMTLDNGIIEMLPQFVEAGVEIIIQLANGIADELPELIPAIVDAVITIVDTLVDHIGEFIDAGMSILDGLIQGITQALPTIAAAVPEIIDKIVSEVTNTETLADLVTAGVDMFIALVQNLPGIIDGIVSKVPKIVSDIAGAFTNSESQQKMAEAGQKLAEFLGEAFVNTVVNYVLSGGTIGDVARAGLELVGVDTSGLKTNIDLFPNPPAPSGGGGTSSGGGGGYGSSADLAGEWQTAFTRELMTGKTQSEAEQIATEEIYGPQGVATTSVTFSPRGYASGGYPSSGDLFYANEGGEPEFVGSVGNRTAVANSANMEEAVAAGTRDIALTLERILNVLSRQNGGGNVDSDRLVRVIRDAQSRSDAVYGSPLA